MKQFISVSLHLSRGCPSACAAHVGGTWLSSIISKRGQTQGEASDVKVIDVEDPKCSRLVCY